MPGHHSVGEFAESPTPEPDRAGERIETKRKITPDEARRFLAKAPGGKVADSPREKIYPHAVDAAGGDDTLVSRIREDESIPNRSNRRIGADNIRTGAALNAVQIAERLIKTSL